MGTTERERVFKLNLAVSFCMEQRRAPQLLECGFGAHDTILIIRNSQNGIMVITYPASCTEGPWRTAT